MAVQHQQKNSHIQLVPYPYSRTARKSRRYQQRYHKRQSHKIEREQALTIAAEEKAFYHRSNQVATAITNKIKQQFGFVADPKKTLLHNASSTLSNTSTNRVIKWISWTSQSPFKMAKFQHHCSKNLLISTYIYIYTHTHTHPVCPPAWTPPRHLPQYPLPNFYFMPTNKSFF